MDFENHKKLQATCNEYILENTFEFKTLKCENNHYIIACRSEGCSWRLHASSISETAIFRIKTYIHEHQCTRIHHARRKQVSAALLADKFLDKFKDQPSYSPSEVIRDVKRDLGVTISYIIAYRIKNLVMIKFNGIYEERERIVLVLRELFLFEY